MARRFVSTTPWKRLTLYTAGDDTESSLGRVPSARSVAERPPATDD
jgi:hypothetical protein